MGQIQTPRLTLFSALTLFVLTFSIPALAGSECRIPGLTLASDIPGVPPTLVTLIADQRTKELRQLELVTQGKTSRISANSIETLFKLMNADLKDDPAVFQFDNPSYGVEQITTTVGNGLVLVDLNLDGAPEVNALKVSGSFSRKSGGTWSLNAYRSFNPFHSRAKLDVTLKRTGERCEDWGFFVGKKEEARQIAGLFLKGNVVGGAIIGVDEIAPIDFNPNTLQKLIGQLTEPAESLDNNRVSDRLIKNTVIATGGTQNARSATGSARSAI